MAQLDLFSRKHFASSVPQRPDPEKIRAILTAALQELRLAEEMPWSAAQLRSWHHVFQNMTKWLTVEERQEFCRSFEVEISRLQTSLSILQIR